MYLKPGTIMETRSSSPSETSEEPTRATNIDSSVRRDRARTISGMSPFAGTQGIAGLIAAEAVKKRPPGGGKYIYFLKS